MLLTILAGGFTGFYFFVFFFFFWQLTAIDLVAPENTIGGELLTSIMALFTGNAAHVGQ